MLEQRAHVLEAPPGRGAEPAVGADAAKAFREHVLEEAAEEGFTSLALRTCKRPGSALMSISSSRQASRMRSPV